VSNGARAAVKQHATDSSPRPVRPVANTSRVVRPVAKIRHLGPTVALCGLPSGINFIRPDLDYARCKQLGVRERFKGEAPYRVCGRCLAVKRAEENSMRRVLGRRLAA
jgi:hypothetical protein